MASFNSFTMLCTYLILVVLCGLVDAEDPCKTLDAAFRFHSKLYLVSGENYYAIGRDMREEATGNLSFLLSRADGQMDAAVVWSGDETLYFFYGTHYFYFYSFVFFVSTYGPYRNSRWTPFFLEGIDAAGRLADRTYFFKGCHYLVYYDAYSEPGRVHDIGLPCDVDAAWDQGDFMVVTKGGQSWALYDSGEVRGPVKISNEITLRSISLCEANDSWTNRNEEELEYEKRNGCVIIDSAVSYEGTVYLFNNDSYVRLDASGKEDLFSRNYDWGGLGKGVDGAVHVPAKNKAYFFQGDEYFAYYGLAFGPLSASSDWAPFFSGGINAAGRRQGLTYFFQGCHVVSYDVENNTLLDIYNSDDLGLPCNVNAAYAKDDSLYVIKGDEGWLWGDDVTGPGSLSEVMNLTSWTICSS